MSERLSDEPLEPEFDPGLPRRRSEHGGMPRRDDDEFECEPRGPIPVKGKGEIEAWYLLGPRNEPESATKNNAREPTGRPNADCSKRHSPKAPLIRQSGPQTVVESDNARAAAYAALSLAALHACRGENSGAFAFRHALLKNCFASFAFGASPYF